MKSYVIERLESATNWVVIFSGVHSEDYARLMLASLRADGSVYRLRAVSS